MGTFIVHKSAENPEEYILKKVVGTCGTCGTAKDGCTVPPTAVTTDPWNFNGPEVPPGFFVLQVFFFRFCKAPGALGAYFFF